MFTLVRTSLHSSLVRLPGSSVPVRHLASGATVTRTSKKVGDISSVFVSLSGAPAEPLPQRFADIKRQLVQGREADVAASWRRLLEQLNIEKEPIAQHGPNVIPEIQFSDISNPSEDFIKQTKKRGAAVIRGVVPEEEARRYKIEVEEYVRRNPQTKAFPAHDPQVFELYWSAPQVKARAHPNVLNSQRFLMNLWHSNDKDALISTSQPLTYADRLRIRQPGDSNFALGPHLDGGSVERWEPNGYGLGGVYDKIFKGKWEEYDPWESSSRLPAVSDLYEGAGACSMFRMFQGWLGISHTAPNEGTLQVNPMLKLATAYILLRPFFEPIKTPAHLNCENYDAEYLSPDNWRLKSGAEATPQLHGASPGHCQELTPEFHPHLELRRTMVHMPKINPGDYVVWHCDTVHAVDKVHTGKEDSSAMYIPVCPTTEANVEYLARQRAAFIDGYPAPDFPGGKGESEHMGRPTLEYMSQNIPSEGLQSMGLAALKKMDWEASQGVEEIIQRANKLLGFA